jgi:mRNA-degrading endonuclease RelE of RelBE toxin-antitoxin system
MEVRYDNVFLKELKKIPNSQHRLFVKKVEMFSEDPFDSRLHTKSLHSPLEGVFSFRISREYRVLFRFISTDTAFYSL